MSDYDFTEDEIKVLTDTPKTGQTYLRFVTFLVYSTDAAQCPKPKHGMMIEDDEKTIYVFKDDEWNALKEPEHAEIFSIADEWVWQYATGYKTAAAQHIAKFQLHQEMQNSCFPELHTY